MNEKQYYNEFAISNSSLSWFQISPKYFKKKLDKELEDLKLKFLEFGKQVHMRILEPELFYDSYIYLEVSKPKSPQQIKFCEEYSKSEDLSDAYTKVYTTKNKSEDKVKEEAEKLKSKLNGYIEYLKKRKEVKAVLSPVEWKSITDLYKLTESHKKAKELLYNEAYDTFGSDDLDIYNELPIFWKYNNIPCKSMVDRLVIDHKNKVIKLIDLKTTSFISNFGKSIAKFNYDRQCAFYWLAVHQHFKKTFKDKDFDEYSYETYIVALQTKDLPECKVFQVEEYMLNNGLDTIKSIMEDITWHFENDKWEYSMEYYKGDGIEHVNKKDYDEFK